MNYLTIEIILFILVFLIQRYFKVRIFRTRKQFIIFWLLVFLFGATWDHYAVYQGHWFYPGKGLTGIFIGKIPLEDYLFMVLVPYLILVAYQVSNKKIEEKRKRNEEKN